MRGLHPIFMDPYTETTDDFISLRSNLGYIKTYADQTDLKNMTPQGALSTTGYCLAKATFNGQYLAFQPGTGGFDVNLTSTTGTLTVEWLNPSTGATSSGNNVTGGTTVTFTPPFSGD